MVLINTFFAINLVNSVPPDLTVIKMVDIVNAGNVAKIPPHFGTAYLLINTIEAITVPVKNAFNQIGLIIIFFGIRL